jgi:hypothetical protein
MESEEILRFHSPIAFIYLTIHLKEKEKERENFSNCHIAMVFIKEKKHVFFFS